MSGPARLPDFETVYTQLPTDGWLTKREAELLFSFALGTTGDILEIGGYLGRSTVLLAHLGRQVYTVDSFTGFAKWDPSGDKIERRFRDNVAPYENVTLYRQRIEDWEPRPCGFCYLDGEHSYIGTMAQIQVALKCQPTRVAAHDVNDKGGGLNVRRACLEVFGHWLKRVGRLAVWQLDPQPS